MSALNQLKRNISDLINDPQGYLRMVAENIGNSAAGRKAVINDRGAGMQDLSKEERRQQMQQAVLDNFGSGGMGALGIIKGKGGNWLASQDSNLDRGLRSLRRGGSDEAISNLYRINPDLDIAAVKKLIDPVSQNGRDIALHDWVEGPLARYIKTQMGTEADPIRALAEQGISHANLDQLRTAVHPAYAESHRAKAGTSAVGKSDLAKAWENVSDAFIEPVQVGPRLKNYLRFSNDEHWVNKLNDGATIYRASEAYPPESLMPSLSFDHLVDEIRNAMDPTSGLPQVLQLTPEKLQQMGMEKAVRHVAKINEHRMAELAAANLEKSQSPAVHLFKEYSENNPKGLRWVELNLPKELPEGWSKVDFPEGGSGYRHKEVGSQTQHPGYRDLLDQLKYEGDTMGHCVGRYCEDVASGRSRIFSLRDAKGEPHVTIETVKGGPLDDPKFDAGLDFDGMAYDEIRRRQPNMDEESDDFMRMVLERAGDMAMEWNKKQAVGSPDRIVQIKGKGNAAPVADYLPFVQDFVKSGNWSDVGDLHNTGLRRTSDAWNKMEQNRIRSHNIEIPPYMTQDEIDAIEKQVWAPNGYANGGLVRRLEENGVAGYLLD